MSTNDWDPVSVASRGMMSRRRVRWVALAAGVMAALLTWAADEAVGGWFRPTRVGNSANPREVQFEPAELNRVEVLNGALAVGVQGALLGLVLGAAGGLARGSIGVAVPAGLAGVVLGGGLGAGAAWGAFTGYTRLGAGVRNDLLPSLLAHEGAWIPVGAAVGLVFGGGLGGRGTSARGMVGGIIGAALGVAVYEVVGAIALPLSQTGNPIAGTMSGRFVAHAAVGLGIALGAAFVATENAAAPGAKT